MFIVGHDGVLHGRVDQPVKELAVCTGDRAVIQAEIVGQGAQFLTLGCGESQIGNRDIKQPDVGRNVNAGVYPLRER
jgi:hypothetical protein